MLGQSAWREETGGGLKLLAIEKPPGRKASGNEQDGDAILERI